MAILRSSILNIQISGKEVSPGFNGTVNKLLKWVDRIYDRERSCYILEDIEKIVKNVPFEAMATDILLTCMATMGGISEEESSNLLKARDDLDADGSLTSRAKSNHLAISIVRITGMMLLTKSIELWEKGQSDANDNPNDESLVSASKRLKEELFGTSEESKEPLNNSLL